MTRRVTGVSGLGELAAASKVTYPLVALSRTKLIYEYRWLRKNIKKLIKKRNSKQNQTIKPKV